MNWNINHDDNDELGTEIKEYEDVSYIEEREEKE